MLTSQAMPQKILISVQDTELTGKFKQWLSARFPLEWVPSEDYTQADFLIGGDFGYMHETFQGVKISITGENHAPDLNNYDYTLTHEFEEDDRRHRLPFWQYVAMFHEPYGGLCAHEPAPISPEELAAQNREFCAFICRNPVCRKRNQFVKRLNAIRKVNCAGPLMNNVGFLLEKGFRAKMDYQGKHLFGVAYENEASPGYQTEKILDVLIARSIPIYWGSPRVEDEFNPEAFINARRFPSERALIRHILELAEDPVRMAAIINAPRYRDPLVLEKADQALTDFFARIFERGPGAIRRSRYQRTQAVLSHFYGHGLFRTIRRLSRHVRGKGGEQGLGNIVSLKGKRKS